MIKVKISILRNFAIFCVTLLTGCANAPAPATQTIQVPVAVPCVKSTPVRPTYEFDQLPITASDGDKVLALVRDWARYRKYASELEAMIVGCI